jgi:hypothetical protein
MHGGRSRLAAARVLGCTHGSEALTFRKIADGAITPTVEAALEMTKT